MMPKATNKETRRELRAYRQTLKHRWDGNGYWHRPVAEWRDTA